MAKVEVRIQLDQNDSYSPEGFMEILKAPARNYSTLRRLLGLFMGEKIQWIEHVFHCRTAGNEDELEMLLVWVLLTDKSNRLYCITVDRWMETNKKAAVF